VTETAQLFVTCLVDSLYPSTGKAVVQVLQRLGVQVELPPGQTCCGQPAFNAGLRRQAEPIARHTIQVFERTGGPVVVPSGSWRVIRFGYLELFASIRLAKGSQPGRRT
jgi:L-lactate dehydrogenase complex protein LldE